MILPTSASKGSISDWYFCMTIKEEGRDLVFRQQDSRRVIKNEFACSTGNRLVVAVGVRREPGLSEKGFRFGYYFFFRQGMHVYYQIRFCIICLVMVFEEFFSSSRDIEHDNVVASYFLVFRRLP